MAAAWNEEKAIAGALKLKFRRQFLRKCLPQRVG
jgi:hypothetical protein